MGVNRYPPENNPHTREASAKCTNFFPRNKIESKFRKFRLAKMAKVKLSLDI